MKCPACGGACTYEIGKGYVCNSCMNVYSAEEISDTIIDKLNYANERRSENYDFDGALQLCTEALAEQPYNQEANWGALLAEYQIIYLRNAKNVYKPTFLNPDVATPIPKCRYYSRLNTDFRRMADLAEEVRLEVVRESNQIPDYDVFISYKQHAGNSDTILTEEADWAARLYKSLVKCGLKVFYDEESLKGGSAGWEPHIYSALRSSKCLIVLGTSLDNFNSTWVKNEWKRYMAYRKKDPDKTFFVAQKNCKPEDLDFDLQGKQILDANDSNWMDILIRNVKDYFDKYKVEYLLAEAHMYLAKRKFKKAKENYSKVCAANPRASKAYWGLLMCRLKAMDDYDLVKCRKKIGKTTEYKNAVNYAQGEERARYEKVGNDNLTHDTVGYNRENYSRWRKETRVQRFFKRLIIIILVLAILITGALSGFSFYNKKSREYYLLLDYGEAVGSTASLMAYKGEDIPVLPANLTVNGKEYLDFVGWFTQQECRGIQVSGPDGRSDIKTDNIASLSDLQHRITLYAGFTPHKYSVTFYDEDEQTVLRSVQAEYGTELGDIASEVYAGDRLVLSWSLQPNGKDFTGTIESDLSLYATSFGVCVTYDSNGGSEIPDATVKVGDRVPMPIPEREYYGFTGWAYQNEIVEYGFTAPGENFTLVATWSKTHFSLSYDADDSSVGGPEYVKAGSTVNLPVLQRDYYKFLGWEYENKIFQNSFTMPEKDVTLVAKWERTHFSLTYDASDSSVDKTELVKAGSTVTLPVLNREYYRFLGWQYNGTIIQNSFVMPKNDVTLTAKWERTHYAVTLDGKTQYVRIGDSMILPTPQKAGYSFKGWLSQGEFYKGAYVPEGDVSFTSQWTAEQYTITLNPNGGTLSQSTATVTYGSVYSLPIPEKKDFVFAGWFTNADSTGRRRTNADGQSVSSWSDTGSVELYAIWVKDYEANLDRVSCKDNNGYDPSESGTEVDSLAHHDWDLLRLVLGGCAQEDDSSYFIPEGNLLSVSFKVLQNPGSLPTWGMNGQSVNWTKHWITSDTYADTVYGTPLNGKAVGKGAYYVKVTYTDGTTTESSKFDFLSSAKQNDVLNVELNLNVNKKISSLQVVAVYELFYDYMTGYFDWNGTQCYGNWRCSTTIQFK